MDIHHRVGARARRSHDVEPGFRRDRHEHDSDSHVERLQRDKIGIVKRPGQDAERSESLALAQLLIVSHLVGAFDGAFEL